MLVFFQRLFKKWHQIFTKRNFRSLRFHSFFSSTKFLKYSMKSTDISDPWITSSYQKNQFLTRLHEKIGKCRNPKTKSNKFARFPCVIHRVLRVQEVLPMVKLKFWKERKIKKLSLIYSIVQIVQAGDFQSGNLQNGLCNSSFCIS